MRNILFIGGAGFIGSNIIRHLMKLESSYNIHVAEPKCADVSRLQELNIIIHRCGLAEIEEIECIISIHKIDTIVHLVSTLVPGSTYEDYLQEFKNIIFPSIELMEICAQKHIKFIYFSSGGTVYGNRNRPIPFTEEENMAPISYYGWSKQMMENGIHFKHRTQNLNYLIIRPSNPYGEGQNIYAKQGLIAVALGKILNNEPITVWGDGSAIRDYIYIDDLCCIFCQLLENNVLNETVNIGTGIGYSVNDVLAFLRIATEKEFKIIYDSPRNSDVSTMILDISKITELTKIEFTSLKDGIKLFYNKLNKQN